jgi:hypothetical protein
VYIHSTFCMIVPHFKLFIFGIIDLRKICKTNTKTLLSFIHVNGNLSCNLLASSKVDSSATQTRVDTCSKLNHLIATCSPHVIRQGLLCLVWSGSVSSAWWNTYMHAHIKHFGWHHHSLRLLVLLFTFSHAAFTFPLLLSILRGLTKPEGS